MEAENDPLLGGGEASIELVPSDDSFGDDKGEVLGIGLDWVVSISEQVFFRVDRLQVFVCTLRVLATLRPRMVARGV